MTIQFWVLFWLTIDQLCKSKHSRKSVFCVSDAAPKALFTAGCFYLVNLSILLDLNERCTLGEIVFDQQQEEGSDIVADQFVQLDPSRVISG